MTQDSFPKISESQDEPLSLDHFNHEADTKNCSMVLLKKAKKAQTDQSCGARHLKIIRNSKRHLFMRQEFGLALRDIWCSVAH